MCKIADWIVMMILLITGGIDCRKKEIPQVLILIMGICVIFFRIVWIDMSTGAAIGGLLAGIFFFWAGKITREAIGYGDAWIILLLGMYRGGFVIVQIVLVASIMSAVFAIVYLIHSGWKQNTAIPFVPFLAAAYLGVVIL